MISGDLPMSSFADFIRTMREELTQVGFTELRTPEEVDTVLGESKGTVFLFVNSVCGCAGGVARPAAAYVVQQDGPRPQKLVTVFAGQDKEATARAREYITGYPPSSPSMALFKDGQVVRMIQRSDIEGHDAATVAAAIQRTFSQYCR